MRLPDTLSKSLPLLELLVTVSIVSILPSITVGSFTTFTQGRNHDLDLAKLHSPPYIESAAICTVIPLETLARQRWLVFVDDDSDGTQGSGVLNGCDMPLRSKVKAY